jgi:hypothetical protein
MPPGYTSIGLHVPRSVATRKRGGGVGLIFNIGQHNRSAKVFGDIQKRLGKLFIINNETRWNSYYNALKRVNHFINKKRSALKALFEVYGIQYFLTAEEELVREYVKMMKPIVRSSGCPSSGCEGFDRITLANADHSFKTLEMLLDDPSSA